MLEIGFRIALDMRLQVQVQQDEEWDDWVRQAFKSLDSNQDGVICEEDMRMTSVDLDEVCTIVHVS